MPELIAWRLKWAGASLWMVAKLAIPGEK